MTKLYITMLSTFLLSNTVWAYSPALMTETNSLSKAVLEIVAMDNQSQKNDTIETSSTPYTHESEKNNSLARGVLAKQGVDVHLSFNSASKVSYSRDAYTNEKNHSLSHGAMAK